MIYALYSATVRVVGARAVERTLLMASSSNHEVAGASASWSPVRQAHHEPGRSPSDRRHRVGSLRHRLHWPIGFAVQRPNHPQGDATKTPASRRCRRSAPRRRRRAPWRRDRPRGHGRVGCRPRWLPLRLPCRCFGAAPQAGGQRAKPKAIDEAAEAERRDTEPVPSSLRCAGAAAADPAFPA